MVGVQALVDVGGMARVSVLDYVTTLAGGSGHRLLHGLVRSRRRFPVPTVKAHALAEGLAPSCVRSFAT